METVLNLIWLVLALAMFCLWRYCWRASQRDIAQKWTAAVALGCALALLFPVISLTDDLHPETVAIDGSSGKRNGRQMLAAASPNHSSPQKSVAHSICAVLRSCAAATHLAVAVQFSLLPCFLSLRVPRIPADVLRLFRSSARLHSTGFP